MPSWWNMGQIRHKSWSMSGIFWDKMPFVQGSFTPHPFQVYHQGCAELSLATWWGKHCNRLLILFVKTDIPNDLNHVTTISNDRSYIMQAVYHMYICHPCHYCPHYWDRYKPFHHVPGSTPIFTYRCIKTPFLDHIYVAVNAQGADILILLAFYVWADIIYSKYKNKTNKPPLYWCKCYYFPLFNACQSGK